MAFLRRKKETEETKRVLTAEGWLRRVRFAITQEMPKMQEKRTPVKKAGRPRGRPKKG